MEHGERSRVMVAEIHNPRDGSTIARGLLTKSPQMYKLIVSSEALPFSRALPLLKRSHC